MKKKNEDDLKQWLQRIFMFSVEGEQSNTFVKVINPNSCEVKEDYYSAISIGLTNNLHFAFFLYISIVTAQLQPKNEVDVTT